MILCILRLTRNEILWYFRHLNQPWNTKRYKDQEIMDSRISELIYLSDRLSELLHQNKQSNDCAHGC